jgi:hypothetical protein
MPVRFALVGSLSVAEMESSRQGNTVFGVSSVLGTEIEVGSWAAHSKFVDFNRALCSSLRFFQLTVGEGGGEGMCVLNVLSLKISLYRTYGFLNRLSGDLVGVVSTEMKLSPCGDRDCES